MSRRTSLTALLVTAAALLPAWSAGASENLLVVRGSGAGSATLVVPRLLRVDLQSLRSSGCQEYAGLSFHGVPRMTRPVTTLRIASVDARAAAPFPVLFGATSSPLWLPPGTYRVDLHADRACAVAVTARGLRAPWVTTVTAARTETFGTSGFVPVGPVVAGAAQWPVPAGAAVTYVVAAVVRPNTLVPETAVPETQACAGPAPHVCAPAADLYAATADQAHVVASRYLAGDGPVEPAWASGRVVGPYVAAAVAMLSTSP